MKTLYLPGEDYLGPQKVKQISEILESCGVYIVSDPGKADALLTVGGDGAVLKAVRTAIRWPKPIISYNTGHLGFLTSGNDLRALMKAWKESRLAASWRPILRMYLVGKQQEWALNEVLITTTKPGKMITLPTTVDDIPLTTYQADGVIFSTSTGSTAYNLSAGGPIIHPGLKAIVVNPVAPFTMANRPIVLPDDAKIRIKYEEDNPISIVMDGSYRLDSTEPCEIEIDYSGYTVVVMRPIEDCFFRSIREKLGWANNIKG